jgi:hypothetical protein
LTRKKASKVLRKQKKSENIQRFTQKQNIGRASLTAKEFRLIQRMSHSAKALRNVGLYTMKQSLCFSLGITRRQFILYGRNWFKIARICIY